LHDFPEDSAKKGKYTGAVDQTLAKHSVDLLFAYMDVGKGP